MFQVETSSAIYELEFYHVQINITSRCNMRCEHCRGAYTGATDLSLHDFQNVLDFCHEHMNSEAGILISGGEPLLHPHFREILTMLQNYVHGTNRFVTITTNGTYVSKVLLEFIKSLNFPETRISVSLDSIFPERHNTFRRSKRAHEQAMRAIKLITENTEFTSIVRATIQKDQLDEIPDLAQLVEDMGANILSISSVIPAGRASQKPHLWFDKYAKKKLVELTRSLQNKHANLVIDVNDPLSYINTWQFNDCSDCMEYGGCIAGIGSFSVEPDGTMLPCPLLPNQPILNVQGLTPNAIMEKYSSNRYIHALLDRNFSGKCGVCEGRYICGGCRARAYGVYGDFLAEDPDCWLDLANTSGDSKRFII